MRLAEYPDDVAFATAIGILPPRRTVDRPQPELPPGPPAEAQLFRRLGLSKPFVSSLAARAAQNGTSLEAELLASGVVSEEAYYEALAETLDLPFLPALDATQVQDLPDADSQLVDPVMVRVNHPARPPVTAIVPSAGRLAAFRERLALSPSLRSSIVATSPSALRAALWRAGRHRRVRETTSRLFETMPEASARITFSGRQGFYTGVALTSLLVLAILFPPMAALVLHVVLSLLFLATFLIRFTALLARRRQARLPRSPAPARPRPVYSVFVALYREAAVVPQLIDTLDRLAWPRSRLDIKLICEADDTETLAALAKVKLGPQYEIVEVPPALPRTKPKALSYALGAARGEFLVIYDAEDRVDPRQLEEAWQTFQASPPDVVCLQAPLVITNARESWISALFALEYAGLFRGLLPLLAAGRLPMPLGGTSNHFRTRILKQAGGWDPYNVTEDADLGLRLFRLGYRCGVLERPTFEDAPARPSAWLGQRTRWFKGWLQTWLVLMRRPARLVADMGLWPAFVFQVLIGGLLLSSLAHPLILIYIAAIAWMLLQQPAFNLDTLTLALFVIDIVNIFGSYAVFIALGRGVMTPGERDEAGWRWLYTPFYWLLMSIAAWRAVGELRSNPFFWNKTAHHPTKDVATAALSAGP